MIARTVVGCRLRVVFVSLALCVGCAPAPQEVLHPVKGRITLDGKPLPRGTVTLRPESTSVTWHQPTGVIEPPGEYVVYTNGRNGAPPGQYQVVVFATEAATSSDGAARPGLPKSLVPPRYNDSKQTPLRLQVVAQPTSNSYTLELGSDEK